MVAAASGVVAGVAAAQSFFGTDGAPTSPAPAPATASGETQDGPRSEEQGPSTAGES